MTADERAYRQELARMAVMAATLALMLPEDVAPWRINVGRTVLSLGEKDRVKGSIRTCMELREDDWQKVSAVAKAFEVPCRKQKGALYCHDVIWCEFEGVTVFSTKFRPEQAEYIWRGQWLPAADRFKGKRFDYTMLPRLRMTE